MKYFAGFFLALIAICLYFGATDEDAGGLFWVAGFFALILVCVLGYNKRKRGGWLSDTAEGGRLNSIALPLLGIIVSIKVAVLMLAVYCVFAFCVWAIIRIGARKC